MYRAALAAGGDIGEALRGVRASRPTANRRPSRWACCRDFGRSRVLVVDSRAARVLDDGRRDMVDDERVGVDRRAQPRGVRPPGDRQLDAGVHVARACTTWRRGTRRCARAPGAARPRWLGEQLRRALDLEHWPAFQRVVRADDAAAPRRRVAAPRATAAGVGHAGRRRHPQRLRRRGLAGPVRDGTPQPRPPARLLALPQPARPCGAARRRASPGRRSPRPRCSGLARLAGVQQPSVRWRYRAGPTFHNSIGILELDGRHARGDDLPVGGRARMPTRCSRCTTACSRTARASADQERAEPASR